MRTSSVLPLLFASVLVLCVAGCGEKAPPPVPVLQDVESSLIQQVKYDAASSQLTLVFTSGETTMTKSYLKFLVDRIVVRPGEVEIIGKSAEAAALMAAAGQTKTPPPVNPGDGVLTSVGDWLQRLDSNQRPIG